MEIKDLTIKQSTATVTASFSPKELSEAETEALQHIGQHKTIRGFRQGKAPISLVKNAVSEDTLREEVTIHLANRAAREVMLKEKFDLIAQPFVSNTKNEKDLCEVELSFPLYPKVELGDYKKTVQSVKTPKTKKDEKPADKLDLILNKLVNGIKFDVPQVLIEREVASSFSRLIDQAQALNLPLEKYLEAIKKNLEDVKKEYYSKAEENLKIELILTAVAEKEQISVPDTEIAEFAKIAKAKEEQFSQLKAILVRRKTIDYLLKI